MSDFRERASEPADISVPSPTPSVDVQSSPAVPAMAQSAEFSSFLGGSLIQRMGGSGQSADVSSTVGALASDSGGAMPHRERGANAGLKADRMPYSKKTGFYYILSAKEMWLYMSANFGAPHQSWPKSGAFKDSADFQKNFDSTIKPVVSARKGVVAFDKIFGYSGTGHVDIFDGEKLSDSPSWYGCQRLKVWYISA